MCSAVPEYFSKENEILSLPQDCRATSEIGVKESKVNARFRPNSRKTSTESRLTPDIEKKPVLSSMRQTDSQSTAIKQFRSYYSLLTLLVCPN